MVEGQAPDRARTTANSETSCAGVELHTVCEEAMCPNIHECWEDREATFLILGSKCTRRCGFCDVMTAKPDPVDEGEPERIAEAVRAMGLRYVVLTGVARDDLPDGGARIWAASIRAIRREVPGCRVEVLPSDFKGGETRHRDGARRRTRRLRAQPRDRPPAARPDPAGLRLRPFARRAPHRQAPASGHGHEVQPHPGDGRTTRGGRTGDARPRGSRVRHPHDGPVPAAHRHASARRSVGPPRRVRRPCPSSARPSASRHVEAGPLVRSSYHAGTQFQRAVDSRVGPRRLSARLRPRPRRGGGAGL